MLKVHLVFYSVIAETDQTYPHDYRTILLQRRWLSLQSPKFAIHRVRMRSYQERQFDLSLPNFVCARLYIGSSAPNNCQTLMTNSSIEANRVDPEQTAPIGAV